MNRTAVHGFRHIAAIIFVAFICLTSLFVPSVPSLSGTGLCVRAVQNEQAFSFEITGQDEALITAYSGKGGDVVLPAALGGKPVTAVADKAFYGCKTVTSLTFPDTVRSIGDRAFWYCTAVKSLTLPKGLTEIGDYAFFGCAGLESVTFPEKLKSIGSFAFSGCTALKEPVLPAGITRLGSSAFDQTAWYKSCSDGDIYLGPCYYRYKGNMPSFYEASVREGTKVLADGAFSSCGTLQSITVPEGVEQIGTSTFFECVGLKTVKLPDSLRTVGTMAFSGCRELEELELKQNVSIIEDGAFTGCSRLKRIVFFEGMTRIGLSDSKDSETLPLPFSGCDSLEKVIYVGVQESFQKIETDPATRALLQSLVVYVSPQDYSSDRLSAYGRDSSHDPSTKKNPIQALFGMENDYDFLMLLFYLTAGVIVLTVLIVVIVHVVRKKRKASDSAKEKEANQMPKWRSGL